MANLIIAVCVLAGTVGMLYRIRKLRRSNAFLNLLVARLIEDMLKSAEAQGRELDRLRGAPK